MQKLINGELWKDTDGNPIHAHGGHMLKYDGYYYWYGEDRRENYYVSCYRSKDLATWEQRNQILTTESEMESIRVQTELILQNSDGSKVNIERPKVLFNEQTQKFVMWVHFENGKDYSAAAAAIATCDTPDGDFVYHGHMQPFGHMSRDCTLYQDDNGYAYFVSAARDNADLHVYRLSDDFLNVDRLVHQLWQGEFREAPAIFKNKGKYYMISSYCTGWAPNQARYATADSIEGDWSLLEDIGDEITFATQPAFALPVSDDLLLYFSDRWDAEDYFNSSYVILPFEIDDGKLSLTYYDQVEVDDQLKFGFKNNN